jgi:hypothetical protein
MLLAGGGQDVVLVYPVQASSACLCEMAAGSGSWLSSHGQRL